MKKFIVWLLIILALIIGGVFVFKRAAKKQEKAPDVVEAKIGTVEEIVSATGTVKSAEDADLGFKASGKIVIMNVEIGEKVEAGQELAGLDTADLDASMMEAQAAVSVAEAQLAEVKAGSSTEEIAAQQVAVLNAEANLAKTQESAAKAIASADAQAASQQVSVDSKKQALEDAWNSAENSLESSYESGLNTASSKYFSTESTLNVINEMFDDNDLMEVLGNLDYQSKINANQAKDDANNLIKALKPFIDAANLSKKQEDIDEALAELKISLNSLDDYLEIIYGAFLKTQPMFSLTKTELDVYKTSITTQRTNVDTAITSVISSQQAISSTKLSNISSINAAQQALDSAEALLAQYQASLESTKASQQAAITSAEGSLKIAEEQLKLKQSVEKPQTVAVFEARLKQSQASLNSVLKKYDDRAITAPVSGVISNIYKEEGETAAASEKIISIVAESGFEIEVDIPESDIVKVGLGNSCDISLDAFPSDKIFEGSVSSIYPAETVVEGVIYYKAKIIFTSDAANVKSGMTANADILTERKESVVAIPIRLIEEKDGKSIVKIQKEDGSIEERQVVKGIRGISGEVEIVEGLSEGEKVVE